MLEKDLELPHEAQRGLLEQQRLEAQVVDVLLFRTKAARASVRGQASEDKPWRTRITQALACVLSLTIAAAQSESPPHKASRAAHLEPVGAARHAQALEDGQDDCALDRLLQDGAPL